MKIRHRLSYILLSCLLLGMLITGGVILVYSNETAKSQVISYIYLSGKSRAEHIRSFLKDRKENSELLAASSVYRDLLKTNSTDSQYVNFQQKVEARVERTVQISTDIYEVCLMDKNGIVVASSDATQVGMNNSKEAFFSKAETGTYIKDSYYSKNIKQVTFVVSSPVFDDVNGTLLGVSAIHYNTTKLTDIVKTQDGIGKTEENFLINSDKYFLTPSIFWGDSVILKNKVDTENTRACFSTKEINYIKKNGYSGLRQYLGSAAFTEAKDYRGVDIVGMHLYIPETGWCMITKIDRAEFIKPSFQLFTIITSIYATSFVLFAVIIYFASKTITNHIFKLTRNAKHIKNGNRHINLYLKTNDEIETLSVALDEMIESITHPKNDN